jgi:hypothetical protein
MRIKGRLERLEREMTPTEPLLVWIDRYSETDRTKVQAGQEIIDLGEEMEVDDAIAYAAAVLQDRYPARSVYALSWATKRSA